MRHHLLVCAFVVVAFVAGILCCSGCGFHFGRTKTPEGGVDENLSIDLLQPAVLPGPLIAYRRQVVT